jgi:hypothetical protein
MPAVQPPTTSDAARRVRAAFDEMAKRKRQALAARRKRVRTQALGLALLAVAASGVLVSIGLYQGWFTLSLPQFAAGGRRAVPNHFDGTRTGYVRTHVRGSTCRDILFDNESGRFSDGNLVPCDTDAAAKNKMNDAALVNALRDGFGRK